LKKARAIYNYHGATNSGCKTTTNTDCEYYVEETFLCKNSIRTEGARITDLLRRRSGNVTQIITPLLLYRGCYLYLFDWSFRKNKNGRCRSDQIIRYFVFSNRLCLLVYVTPPGPIRGEYSELMITVDQSPAGAILFNHNRYRTRAIYNS